MVIGALARGTVMMVGAIDAWRGDGVGANGKVGDEGGGARGVMCRWSEVGGRWSRVAGGG